MKLSSVLSVLLSFAIVSQAVPMDLSKRRFGVEHTPEADATFQDVKDLAQGSDKEAQAGNLSGAMVRALLAKAPACDQQDRADDVIDLGRQFGGDKEQQFIKVAQTYRQLERNTPNAGQASELCTKPPRNKELDGLTQAQDPTGKAKDPADTGKGKDKAKDPADTCTCKAKDPVDTGKAKDPTNTGDNPANTGDNTAETNPVGGVKMPKIQKQNGEFVVNGNSFKDVDAAHGRQCDVQHNLCFNKFNAGDKSFSGADCDNQTNVCKSGPPVFA
uniref:Late protein n=1 Tax=Anthurium amnicola TaxID=1678845 RepID=A0A1D1ZL47_9ARAE